ncbi:hypothetical protein Pla123a_13690 [Posidoniimonas polymericola]|uniref:Uncharacterized protein n=1 Tax=Posidoniimonas polymericola TaxID=2528002 RepID=A0A5C5YV05_9BACT|nr:hypothetical protein [Posidoniimonas polymericola]TWT78576.1 hypothetical protein Pla123a_13690 [Posidoniimonas polymericola]
MRKDSGKSLAERAVTYSNILFAVLGVVGIGPALFATKLFEPPESATLTTVVFAAVVMIFPGACLVSIALSRTMLGNHQRRQAVLTAVAPALLLIVLIACLLLARLVFDDGSGAYLRRLLQVFGPG